MIIEKVTGHTVADEIKNRLLIPLELKNTSYPVTDPAGVMVSDMADMKKWVKAYVTGSTNSAATQKARLACVPIGKEGLFFGLGIGCSGGWYGYTGGIPGYHTGAYYFPAKDATIIAFVNAQIEKPDPGVANSIVRDFTQILFPENVIFPPSTKSAQAGGE
jgi:D-alanyl-D-alanine carboxypeptidase